MKDRCLSPQIIIVILVLCVALFLVFLNRNPLGEALKPPDITPVYRCGSANSNCSSCPPDYYCSDPNSTNCSGLCVPLACGSTKVGCLRCSPGYYCSNSLSKGCGGVCKKVPICGDAICEPTYGENWMSCPLDCPGSCGNGVCEPSVGENWRGCPEDCPPGSWGE